MSARPDARPRDTVAVVLHFRREAMTADCVAALLAQEGGAPTVLIVDNHSQDGSAGRLRTRFPDVPVLETGENLGYAGGNNVGVRWAAAQGARYVFVVNDDARPAPDCLARLRAHLEERPQAAAAAPTILHETPADVVWWAGGHFDALRCMGVHEGYGQRWTATGAGPRRVGFVSGCAVLLRVAALGAAAFREDFGAYLEDVDLSLRLQRQGGELWYVPSALLVHRVPFPEPEIAPWKIVLRDRNRRRVAAAHLQGAARGGFWVFFALSRSLRALQYLLRGDGARARAIVHGMWTDSEGMPP